MSNNPPKLGTFQAPDVNNFKFNDIKTTDVSIDRPSSASVPSDPHETDTQFLPHRERPFKFVTTWRFWGILVLGQILSWCIVSTNTLTEYLYFAGANIPAFQTVFNYALLNLVYTSWTLYKYGFKKWTQLIWKDGWKYIALAFADVQGAYFPPLLH
jgi:Solute carrier family 35